MGCTASGALLCKTGILSECHMVGSRSISTFPRLFLVSCQILFLFCNGLVTDHSNVHAPCSHLQKCMHK